MGLHLEVQGYKIEPRDLKVVIFDEQGDYESYDTHRAWDLIPNHGFRRGKGSGDGGTVKLTFDSAVDAQTGLTKLKEIKVSKKA